MGTLSSAPLAAIAQKKLSQHFKVYNRSEILSLTRNRQYETKIGERIKHIPEGTDIASALQVTTAKYVLLGVAEDLGVKANGGVGGADTMWFSFLTSFLNMQSNDFFPGDDILLAGYFDFGDIQYLIDTTAKNDAEKIEACRHAVDIIDDEVEQLIDQITAAGKLPIVIGGGHNNAYPLLKGAAKGWNKCGRIASPKINCINLDAHSDYRTTEGRHSGNAFRYALEDGYVKKYFVVGLQENYVPQNVWMDMVNNPSINYILFDDIFLHERIAFPEAVKQAVAFTLDEITGVELDMDIIQNSLSSAVSSIGISPIQARQYCSSIGASIVPAYLHICEGATQLDDGRSDTANAKLISFLVSDFVKANAKAIKS